MLDKLATLPDSCVASAACLERQRGIYEQAGVFSHGMIDGIIAELRAYDDTSLRHDIESNRDAVKQLVDRYFHCG